MDALAPGETSKTSDMASRWRLVLAAAAVAWAIAIVATPAVASRPGHSDAGSALVIAIYSIGHFICHQRPERSFVLWSTVMPVCARCTGIYFGAAAAAIAVVVAGRPNGDIEAGRHALILATLPMLATLVYEWTTGVMPSNALRALSGAILGTVAASVVMAATGGGTPDKSMSRDPG